jgi:hypothetical protein
MNPMESRLMQNMNPARESFAHEVTAQRWTEAKTRLDAATKAAATAQAELEAAHEEEGEAWSRLWDASGHGPKQATDNAAPNKPYRSFDPNLR